MASRFISIGAVLAALLCLAACETHLARLDLSSGPIDAQPPYGNDKGYAVARTGAPNATTANVAKVNAAIVDINRRSNTWLHALHSPAVYHMPDTLQTVEGQNEFYQVAAILTPALATFSNGYLFWKVVFAGGGAIIGYKATKGSAATQNTECKALNSVITDIQLFDGRWTRKFQGDADAYSGTDFTTAFKKDNEDMETESAKIDTDVKAAANFCMNPYHIDSYPTVQEDREYAAMLDGALPGIPDHWYVLHNEPDFTAFNADQTKRLEISSNEWEAWHKIDYAKDQVSLSGTYKVRYVLLHIICGSPGVTIRHDIRFTDENLPLTDVQDTYVPKPTVELQIILDADRRSMCNQ